MFCPSCGHVIENAEAFCPECGADLRKPPQGAAPAPVEPMYAPPAGPPPYVQMPTDRRPDSAYAPAGVYMPPAQPAQKLSRFKKVNRTGFTLALILSITALVLFTAYIIVSTLYYAHFDMETRYIVMNIAFGTAELLFSFLVFFILCLLTKKLPAFITAIGPALYVCLVFVEMAAYCIMNVAYVYTGIYTASVIVFAAGVALSFVSLISGSGSPALRIIAAVLLGLEAAYLLADYVITFIRNISYLGLGDNSWLISSACYRFGLLAMIAALMIILFTSKRQIVPIPSR